MKFNGWISVYRDLQNNWVWEDKPFSKGQAWIDLIMMANHKSNKFVLGSELIEVERGQFITSELKLMERWGWGKTKTRAFLKLLEDDGMIVKKSDRKKTTINIVNYSVYQVSETTEEPQTDHEQTTDRPQADRKPDTNNKINNENNDNKKKKEIKNKYGEFNKVFLSDEEYKKLLEKFVNESILNEWIRKVDEYCEMNGKTYKSHYATILNWSRKEEKKPKESIPDEYYIVEG